MKYIRTEGGVYEFEKRSGNEFHLRFSDDLGIVVFLKEGEYTEADTIEELCDEVVRVVHYTKAKPSFVRPLPGDWEENGKSAYTEAMERCLEEQKEMKLRGDDFDLYGAIWTKGGLIYVAKMNKKGELELL